MSDDERRAVVTADDLDTLDEAEIIEGYRDGFEGFPCGENRGRSYWHGWKNGMTDTGRMDMTVEGKLLVRSVLSQQRLALTLEGTET
ncbi:MAG: hypothetical protein H0W39_00925 [Sphingomonas sp.]|nr:hypothetical protein [Sphingomonas sp.]